MKNNYDICRVMPRYNINRMHSARELVELLRREKGVEIPAADDVSALARPMRVGAKIVPNSIAVNPMEGFDADADGNPTDSTYRRYTRFAQGGAGLLWFESFAVSREGQDCPTQLGMLRHNIKPVRALLASLDETAQARYGAAHKPYKVLQINHSGRRCTGEDWKPQPIIVCENPFFDCRQRGEVYIADDAHIERTVEDYIRAAENAAEAGFDGVDLKLGHNYYLSNLMSAFTRPGKYGGSFENRTRAIVEIVDGIRKRCGDAIDICVRMNAYDAIPYPYGWGMVKQGGVMEPDPEEPVRLLHILADKGAKMANISIGSTRIRPYGDGEYALTRGVETDQYLGAYHILNAARMFRKAVPELLYVGTGMTWFDKFCGNVGAGCIEEGWIDIAGYARQALAYPDFAVDLLTKGELDVNKLCVMCDRCHMLSMRKHTRVGCACRNEEYGELYTQTPDSE